MVTLSLTPMLVQYLVGLCCLRWDPNAVDVIIGDMVLDTAAGKERDVDVTVTVSDSGGISFAFKAYEEKRESAPLDVTTVEQLCLKLLDMPTITHRAIVSASGFTDGAQMKAAHHGIELYAFNQWTRPLQEQFPMLTMRGTIDECFPMKKFLLCWVEPNYSLISFDAPADFAVKAGDQMLNEFGKQHEKFATFGEYQQELLLRSTEILCTTEPATTVMRTFPVPFALPEGAISAGPAWPHTHTLDVSRDAIFVTTKSGNCRLDQVTINGYLHWQRSSDKVLYYVVERVPGGEAFAGALISKELREGQLKCLVFSPKTREIGIHFVRLAEKHSNAIRRLHLDIPESSTK